MPSVLTRPTLVLNRNWQPVGVAPVARSLVMVWNETARFVDPADYQLYDWHDWTELVPENDELFIQTVNHRLKVPEVITLTRFDRVPHNTVAFCRRNIFKRDRYTCQYCGSQPGASELTIDHVIPRSRDGKTDWENCVLACVKCNSRKADRTPEEAHMRLLHQPVRPRWKPLYASRGVRIDSWSKFVSEAYWNIELQEDQ